MRLNAVSSTRGDTACQVTTVILSRYMIREGELKYTVWGTGMEHPPQLFNLTDDPDEMHDLAHDKAYTTAIEALDRSLRAQVCSRPPSPGLRRQQAVLEDPSMGNSDPITSGVLLQHITRSLHLRHSSSAYFPPVGDQVDYPKVSMEVATYNLDMAKWWTQTEPNWRAIVNGTGNSTGSFGKAQSYLKPTDWNQLVRCHRLCVLHVILLRRGWMLLRKERCSELICCALFPACIGRCNLVPKGILRHGTSGWQQAPAWSLVSAT